MSRTFLDDMYPSNFGGGRSSVWRDVGEVVTGEGPTLPGPAPREAAPKTVLIVEDDPAVVRVLVQALAEAGHAVVGPAASVAVAARLAEQYPVDVALIGGEAARDGRADTFARRLKETWALQVVRVGEDDGAHGTELIWDAAVSASWRTSEVLSVLDHLTRPGG